jgi:tetratricopeptide (TPR) repeat protein
LFHPSSPISARFPDNLGKALDASGKDSEAVADFDKAIKLAPQNAAIHADRGLALFHEAKYEDSAAAYRQALESTRIFPKHKTVLEPPSSI